MKKVLLEVTRIQGSVCSAEANFDTDEDRRGAAASIVSVMAEDEAFAKDIVTYAALYVSKRDEFMQAARDAKHRAEIKTKN